MKALLFLFAFIIIASNVFSQSASKPCTTSEAFNQLDFWVGEWVVTNPDGSKAGHNKISKILDDCTLLEEWTGAGASRGKSLNFYNPQKKRWQQVWIDNFANPLYFDGEARPDSMIYTGTSLNVEGSEILNMMILSKVSNKEVRQLWSQSADQGENWNIVFDGKYLKLE